MRIAQLATNVEKVPPDGYGGTELVVYLLTEELVRLGHQVSLFATGDSRTSARLVSVTQKALRTDKTHNMTHWQAFDLRTLMRLEDLQDEFDIVHNHMGWQALPTLKRLRCPSITTNHNPIKDYSIDIYKAHRDLPYVAISESYMRNNCGDELNYAGVVYNGIACDDFGKNADRRRDYLLFIGRLDRDKGAANAIRIARRLGLPLKMAGKVDKNDLDYFNNEVKPLLDEPGIEYVGEVNYQQKIDLYEGAIAVVYPIAFEEPFGLVMAEALASGTPVMALNRGAVSEILQNGETAVVGDSIDDLVNRYDEVSRIDRRVCMERVREKFCINHMVAGYLEHYERLLKLQPVAA